VLKLRQADYDEIITSPKVEEVDPNEALCRMEKGAVLLDVRYQMERDEGYITDSIYIPMHDLRHRITELDPATEYVVQCRSGNRSRAAARILTQAGLRAVSLKGGIVGWPFDLVGDTY
jgi:rhodanese-related sulfurtransferase